jgi:hypothetical protein
MVPDGREGQCPDLSFFPGSVTAVVIHCSRWDWPLLCEEIQLWGASCLFADCRLHPAPRLPVFNEEPTRQNWQQGLGRYCQCLLCLTGVGQEPGCLG